MLQSTSPSKGRLPGRDTAHYTRRGFLGTALAGSFAFTLPQIARPRARQLKSPIKLGLIADLHQDIMHDGPERLRAFVQEMARQQPDAIFQLGDFAYPNPSNKEVIDLFNQAHDRAFHVIGNHDTDAGHTQQQCLDIWGMPGRYYAANVHELALLVLDGNDKGSPSHKGGYPSYIGPEQIEWLKKQLASVDGPVIVISHQPLAGTIAVDNAGEIRQILEEASDKVLLAINGHSHIDDLLRIKDVTYMHVNSASYQWVGGDFKHQSYPEEVHAKHPWISYTCPYRESLFATLTIDPENQVIRVEGRRSEWVGPSPAEIGADSYPELIIGEEIAPRIRDRTIERIKR